MKHYYYISKHIDTPDVPVTVLAQIVMKSGRKTRHLKTKGQRPHYSPEEKMKLLRQKLVWSENRKRPVATALTGPAEAVIEK